MEITIDDVVARVSYGKDIYFKVVSINHKDKTAYLKGIEVRLCADAPLNDLVRPGIGELATFKAKSLKLRAELAFKVSRGQRRQVREAKKKSSVDYVNVPGTVLHIDGDLGYIEQCKKAYTDLHLVNHCFHIAEHLQPQRVKSLLAKYNPDILVLTGHDGKKLEREDDAISNYHNTGHYIDAISVARKYQPGKDELVIFAGACQSLYQALINAGANFASSPKRVLIHCLDPVLVVAKVAFTPVSRTVNLYEALSNSITGLDGVGGVETKGQFRLGLPKIEN